MAAKKNLIGYEIDYPIYGHSLYAMQRERV